MTLQFRCKNALIFVTNVASTFLVAWKAIKGWLDPMIVNKVTLLSGNTCDELR